MKLQLLSISIYTNKLFSRYLAQVITLSISSWRTSCIWPFSEEDKKKEIWPSPMTIAPTPTDMAKGQSDNTNNAPKKFDQAAIADRLRTVSWSSYSHQTGVVQTLGWFKPYVWIKINESWKATCVGHPEESRHSNERKRKISESTQSFNKTPLHLQKIQKATWQHKNATENFDYTTIADRLRTVSG